MSEYLTDLPGLWIIVRPGKKSILSDISLNPNKFVICWRGMKSVGSGEQCCPSTLRRDDSCSITQVTRRKFNI